MTQTDIFRLGGTPPRMLELLDGMHASDPDRWMPRRLVLQNFWLFEEPEVFHFARGNLMLTGQNESGKSTVLVTVMTLVLDMVLTPDRVDTMGSNDRSIRYYLVGKDDATEDAPTYHRERTAYIALEFERGRSGRFVTIGIGLRCSREWTNQKVDRWGFVVEDGRRVEIELHLHDAGSPARSLREHELKERLGRGGRVFKEQSAYKTAVQEALFGFQTLEEYERLLDMLHVVRTPKLGEGLNPKKVEGYLKESLPPIQSAAIESASDVFSKLDTIEAELDRLGEQIRVAAELEGPQEAAVLAAARHAAVAYRAAAREHRGRQDAFDKLVRELAAAREEVSRQERIREALSAERAERQGRLDVLKPMLRAHEAFDREEQLTRTRADRDEAAAAHVGLLQDRRGRAAALEREQEQIRGTAGSWEKNLRKLGERLGGIADAARRAYWPSLERRAGLAGDALRTLGVEGGESIAADLARSTIGPEAAERIAVLTAVVSALDGLASAHQRHEEARLASKAAGKEYDQADQRYRSALRETESARAATREALDAWRGGCTVLRVGNGAFDAVGAAVDSYQPRDRHPASPVVAPLEPAYDTAREQLRAHRDELGLARTRLRGDVQDVEASLRRLAEEKEVEPERTPATQAARRLLREHGIAHAPLFAVCDLTGPLAEDAALASRFEAALLHAGLLDALVVPAAEAPRVRALLEAHGLGDRWIRPAPEEGLAQGEGWLASVATAELEAEDVRAALRTVAMPGVGVVDADGGWRLGPLEGLAAAPAEGRVRFLGETARREERRRRIEEARVRLMELRDALQSVEAEIEEIRNRERALDREWRAVQNLPQLQALHDRLQAAWREEQERERRRGIAELAAEAVEAAAREVQQKTAALDRATDAAPYLKGRSRAEVDAVALALREVVELVGAAGDDVERLEELRRAYAERSRSADELRLLIEELAPRIARADERLQTFEASIRTLEEQLRTVSLGREELANDIAALEARLTEIAAADREATRVIDSELGSIRAMSRQEEDQADQLRTALYRKEEQELVFHRRIEAYPATLDEYVQAARTSGPDRAMQMILHDADPAAVDDEAARVRESLQAAFVRASGAFEEMSPTLDGDLLRFTLPEGPMRLDELYRALEDERARKETLLEEEDRRLIEQLMLREVVDAIRAAIAQTRRWVDEVNRILGGMQLFKGGIMRLHWEVRPPERTDAFDPRRLDDLLSQRGIALDEARREELLEIFRTMVADVRRKNRENELLEDYRTALLRMVDYTQWYSLTVQRRDESGRWAPLTRRLYGQGSGGRRTLDLLLPLVAAVSARLAAAEHTAPRMIGFDEAFAGVDDRNAAEIYGLLSELGFCWIMATEKSAGLGPQVRGSATYELLTDGATVAPLLSLWDGERRYEFVGDELLGVQVSSQTALEANRAS